MKMISQFIVAALLTFSPCVEAGQDDFESSPRILAMPQSVYSGSINSLRSAHGKQLSRTPGRNGEGSSALTLGGFRDRENSTVLRAAVLDVDALPIELSDGRVAFILYWSKAAIAAWQDDVANNRGPLRAIEELTQAEFLALQPEESEEPDP